jgi:hypothetical protein
MCFIIMLIVARNGKMLYHKSTTAGCANVAVQIIYSV